MPMKSCSNCGAPFAFADGEQWKTLCLPCWKQSRAANPVHASGNRDSGFDERILASNRKILDLTLRLAAAERELQRYRAHVCPARPLSASPLLERDNLMALRRLCHPDRHAGSEAATRLTQMVNQELQQRPSHGSP